MQKTETITTCDFCGKEIDGDYLEITTSHSNVSYHVHQPRTGAIIECGNIIMKKLDELFPNRKQD